jgi:hypothetical protein
MMHVVHHWDENYCPLRPRIPLLRAAIGQRLLGLHAGVSLGLAGTVKTAALTNLARALAIFCVTFTGSDCVTVFRDSISFCELPQARPCRFFD